MTGNESFGAMKYQYGYEAGIADGEEKAKVKVMADTLRNMRSTLGSL